MPTIKHAHRPSQGGEAQNSKNIQLVLNTIPVSLIELRSLQDGPTRLIPLCFGWFGRKIPSSQTMLHYSEMGE